MLQPEDLVLYHRNGGPVAVAEVKMKFGTSPEWAAQLRRNILAHGSFRPTEFFLIVTPEWVYLWKNAGTEPVAVPPTYVIDARPVLKPYFDAAHAQPHQIDGCAFELVVGAWLAELTRTGTVIADLPTTPAGLTQSKLLQAINAGRVEYAAAA